MCRIKADAFRGQSMAVLTEIIKDKEESFAVMVSGISKLHQNGKFGF